MANTICESVASLGKELDHYDLEGDLSEVIERLTKTLADAHKLGYTGVRLNLEVGDFYGDLALEVDLCGIRPATAEDQAVAAAAKSRVREQKLKVIERLKRELGEEA